MQTSPRLTILLYHIFTSRGLDYTHIKCYSAAERNELFDHCSLAALDECMSLLILDEAYELCAAIQLIIDARLHVLINELIKDSLELDDSSSTANIPR